MAAGTSLRALIIAALFLVVAAAGPPADAQQAPKTAKIGILSATTPDGARAPVEAFKQGLRDLGWVEGKSFVLEVRYGEGKVERLSQLARELVALKMDVIVTPADLSIAAVKRETQTIPIVMVLSSDPVGAGFVATLARPGGNITGLSNISPELSGKRLELLREAIPRLSRVALLWNPEVRGAVLDYKEATSAARSLRVEVQSVEAPRAEDLDRAFSAITSWHAQALMLPGVNPIGFANRARIVSFAQKNRLPSMYPTKEYVVSGGLMSYGPSLVDLFGRAAGYVDKILKGAKPGDLPVQQPTKFELVINLKTAKALGLTLPPPLLRRADEVIQ
jgi:putative ABC transport system substrate-binding protein